ncbi:MAG: hypothetical protein NTY68_00585 [Candidatus Micrarchaeota archaeon]|nr:hypothetical protein [Candidatus Micrarchaeota archaeon]
MNKALAMMAFIFSITLASAEFSITTLNIDFTVNKDGTVNAVETADILISGTNDIFSYTDHLNNSDVGTWMEYLGSNLLTLHVDRTYAKISNINIRPQPIRNLNSLQQKANGRIIITYDVGPYPNEENNTGMFFVNNIKPRSRQMELNEKALSFIKSSSGYIVLDDRTTLNFIFPEGTKLTDANPPPTAESSDNGKYTISWNGMILPNFTLKVENSQTIVDEINSYFDSKMKSIQEYISTDQGKIMVGMVIFILGFIFFLSTKKASGKGGEK